MTSKIRHDVEKFVMMSKTCYDAKKFITTSKTRHDTKQVAMTSTIRKLVYSIQMNEGGTRKVVHRNRLRPYRGNKTLTWASCDVKYCAIMSYIVLYCFFSEFNDTIFGHWKCSSVELGSTSGIDPSRLSCAGREDPHSADCLKPKSPV